MHRFREPVNGFTHFIGVILGFVALIWLMIETREDRPDKMISLLIYGVSIVLLYTASTVFHLAKGTRRRVLLLRRIDHAAIYIMIAGTYTPLVYNVLPELWRWSILGIVWTMAVVGIIYKLLFLRGQRNVVSTLMFIGMGWMGLITLPQALLLLDMQAVWLIIIGGLVYTTGAVIFTVERPNLHRHFGHHALWHVFVLAGSMLHFAAVAGYVV
jgi:hemolysin III